MTDVSVGHQCLPPITANTVIPQHQPSMTTCLLELESKISVTQLTWFVYFTMLITISSLSQQHDITSSILQNYFTTSIHHLRFLGNRL